MRFGWGRCGRRSAEVALRRRRAYPGNPDREDSVLGKSSPSIAPGLQSPGFAMPLPGQWRGFMSRKNKVTFDPKKFLTKVGDGKTIAKYQKDQIVFSQGDVADAVFYIQKGKLKLSAISEQGKEAVIAILGPGHFFGEGCLNGHGVRVATTTAMDECMITRIAKPAMIATLHSETDFSELFMSYLLARNSRIEEDLVDQLFNSRERRLARLLLLLANFGKEGRTVPIVGKISQETLAEMIGTTRARVSFFMNKFRKLGYIDYDGHLNVHNSLLNVVLYDKLESDPNEASGPRGAGLRPVS
jgi:CRP/FNR family transcriptional regulator, cyclic AMP receptor protein